MVQRRVVRPATFAQVPLLNESQLVTSWREMLPPLAEVDMRRIPLEIGQPGVYVVEAVNDLLRAQTIVVVSDLGLLTKTAPGQVLAYTADRFTGEPAAGCVVDVLADRAAVAGGETGDDGVWTAAVDGLAPDSVVVVARCGDQATVSDPGAWYLRDATRELVGYLYTDKPIYRPGHTVRIKAVLRWRARGALAPFDRRDVEVTVTDTTNKVVLRERRPVDEFGSVDATFPVPTTAALGYYSIRVASEDDQTYGSFEVQEYRRPEFEVLVSTPDRFVVQGGTATATIEATYYFGQPVSGGVVRYALYRGYYQSPLAWSDDPEDAGGWYGDGGDQMGDGTARLDAAGRATITVPVAALEGRERGRDYSLRIGARVTDASDREVSGDTTLYGTYGPFMVVASAAQYLYAPGAPATLDVRALDYLGAPRAGVPVAVRLERLRYTDRYGEPDATTVAEAVVETDEAGRASWRVTMPGEGGSYRFRASAEWSDRRLEGNAYAWVPGSTSDAYGDDQFLELMPDRREYQPGDVARLVLRGDPVAVTALVTKEGAQVTWHDVTALGDGAVVEVPIAEADIGDTYVSVVYLKDDRLYRAEKRLRVPATSRAVAVSVEPAKDVFKPQEAGVVTVRTTDAEGRPVRAQVSLAVIDEAVFAVKPDSTPDPLRFFHRLEYTRVGTSFSRDYSFVGYSGAEPLQLAQRRRPLTLSDFKSDGEASRPQVRREFPDAIYWIADLDTGPSGEATVRLTYPDALTTWRLTARAVTIDTRVGAARARTRTTKDLILQLATPRFLTEGDEVGVPAIVHNYLPDDQRVSITVSAAGVTAVGDAAGPHVADVAPGGEHRSDWRFRADRPGTATFTGEALAPDESDAVEIGLPVLPYGLAREATAAGTLFDAAEQTSSLEIPAASNPSARSIRVALAPSLGGALLGALDFLTSYPYGCTEQTLSSVLPNLLVGRAFDQLGLARPERLVVLDRQVRAGFERLYRYQHEDGGWGWWPTDPEHPFMTAYAVYGLVEAKNAGQDVDEYRAGRGASALARLYDEYQDAVPDLKAYLVWVLARADAAGLDLTMDGRPPFDVAAATEKLWSARDRMTAYGRALLLSLLDTRSDARANALAADVVAEARTRGDLAWWPVVGDPLLRDFADTDVEATAMMVRALVARDPANPIIEPAVRWLVASRTGGYWWNTKQTAMALYGLLDYMRARQEQPARYTVDVFVNGEAAGSHTFTPESWMAPDPVVVSAPGREGANEVRLVRRGDGPVYWSATAAYFDNRETIAPEGSRRLALAREYFTLLPVERDGRIVYRETPFDGRAQPGDLLLVRLTAAGSGDWRFLMIEDPLPAGAEAVRQDGLYEMERPPRGWSDSRREYRDDRVVMFQRAFTEGRYEYTYLLKVVTPGVFRALPPRIAPMYVPNATASGRAQPMTVSVAAAGAGGAR